MLLERSTTIAAALTLAMLAHWGLRRLRRRLPRWLARRAGAPPRSAVMPPWDRPIMFAVLGLKVVLWTSVWLWLSEQVPALRNARMELLHALWTRLAAPLFTLNERSYSTVDLLALPALLALWWVVASALSRLLETLLWRTAGLEDGASQSFSVLVRYVLLFLGGLVILQSRGVDVSTLTIVASVLGVGIGFGLQNLANNFVSGLVIGFERPVQPGHFVRVGDLVGTVIRIGARSTSIRTLDGVTILVPNAQFLEHEVVNWSYGDPVSRVRVPVGVAYGSDVARVRSTLLDAAESHPDVLTDPEPRVEFRGFGDSALSFELMVWTRLPERQFRLQSDLNYRIEARLRRNDITIPFPQRDLHLRSPDIAALVAALGRRHFSTEELAAAVEAVKPAAAARVVDLDGAGAPRRWTEEELTAVAVGLRGEGGVPLLDRRHLFKVYRQCFIGREAVDWLAEHQELSRADAARLGRALLERGIIRHVLDEHGFEDSNFFYRFEPARDPGDARASNDA